MKGLHAVAVMAVALGAVGLLAVGCEKAEPQAAAPTVAPVSDAQPEIAQKICPVMGGTINPEIYVDYNGRRIYFCCSACQKAFGADPDKYIAKVDEQLKDATKAVEGEMPMPMSDEHANE